VNKAKSRCTLNKKVVHCLSGEFKYTTKKLFGHMVERMAFCTFQFKWKINIKVLEIFIKSKWNISSNLQ